MEIRYLEFELKKLKADISEKDTLLLNNNKELEYLRTELITAKKRIVVLNEARIRDNETINNLMEQKSRRNMQIRELKLQVKKITADCYKAEADLAEYKLINR